MSDTGPPKPTKPDFKNTGKIKEQQLLGAAAGLSGTNNSKHMYGGTHFDSASRGGGGGGSKITPYGGASSYEGGKPQGAGVYGSMKSGSGSVASSTTSSPSSGGGGGASYNGGTGGRVSTSEKSYQEIAREALDRARGNSSNVAKSLSPAEKIEMQQTKLRLLDGALKSNKRNDPQLWVELKKINEALGLPHEDTNGLFTR